MIPQPGGGGPKVYLGPIKTPLHALFTFYVEMFFALLTSTFVARKSPHPDFLSFFSVSIIIIDTLFGCIILLLQVGMSFFETFMNVENHHLWLIWQV